MKIDYEALADKAASTVADWGSADAAVSMYAWVHKDPARFAAWLEWASQKETERLTELAHVAQAEARATEREWSHAA